MNKIFGTANKHYKRLQHEFTEALKQHGYIVLASVQKDGVGQFQREIISNTVLERDGEIIGKQDIGGGFVMEGKTSSPIALIQMSPVTMEKTQVVITTFNEQIKQILKSLEVFFDGDIPDIKNVPFEVMKKREAAPDKIKLVQYWCLTDLPDREIAKKLGIELSTFKSKKKKIIGDFDLSDFPEGTVGRKDFKKKYSYFLPEWLKELDE